MHDFIAAYLSRDINLAVSCCGCPLFCVNVSYQSCLLLPLSMSLLFSSLCNTILSHAQLLVPAPPCSRPSVYLDLMCSLWADVEWGKGDDKATWHICKDCSISAAKNVLVWTNEIIETRKNRFFLRTLYLYTGHLPISKATAIVWLFYLIHC